ncbi:MAG: 16S rRNA (adenine(1518)-N(6)/adenine(1519)-N(6))-dimethyltransferase RsmA [Pseudomonadota bacterium]
MSSHIPRKRFGQHFLHDGMVIHSIVGHIQELLPKHVVEIGPGLGALTRELIGLNVPMTLVEIDRDLVPKLQANFDSSNVQVIQADALKFDFNALGESLQTSLTIVGNLPYNISTPLLFHLLDNQTHIQNLLFMLQKEVVDRLCAVPQTKAYGRLSVLFQAEADIHALFDVPANAFNPPPKVMSAVVHLHFKANNFSQELRAHLHNITRDAFQQRRKKVISNLKNWFTLEEWQHLGFDSMIRAEALSVEDYIELANYLVKRTAFVSH